MRHHTKVACLVGLVLLSTFIGLREASAQQLTISPTRAVLDTNERTAELTLTNRGDREGTYRIELIHMRMTEEGNIVEVSADDPERRFADDLVRYAPRQVTLAPGRTQSVRVMLRTKRGLEPGEYRSRIAFKAVPHAARATSQSAAAQNGRIQLDLQVISSIAIPLIVRHGKLAARPTLEELEILDSAPRSAARRYEGKPVKWLAFELGRKGNRSIYGDLVAMWVPEEGAEPILVGKIGGVAVYTEINQRRVTMPLLAPDGRSLDSGKIVVGFQPAGSKRFAAQSTLDL